MFRQESTWLLVVLAISTITSPQANGQATLFVDDDAPAGGDGTSWITAFTHLQDALAVATADDEIRVAEGTYTPDQDEAGNVIAGDRNAMFQLVMDVAIYGGYAGLGTPKPDVRNIVLHTTTLSGDLAGNDTPVTCEQSSPDCDSFGSLCVDGHCIIKQGNAENSFHVVTGRGTDDTALLDGFTITAGNANGIAPDGSNQLDGGGMIGVGNMTVNNCIFSGNSATDFGGGMVIGSTNPTVSNCTFSGNTATGGTEFSGGGGGMASCCGSNPTVSNCTFRNNTATGPGEIGGGGGGVLNHSSSPTMTNCIFRGNNAGTGGGMENLFAGSPSLSNCVFSGNAAKWGGGMMLDENNTTTLTNCVFSGNSAELGGGITIQDGGSTTINNCIFWGDSPEEIFNFDPTVDPPTVRFSNVQGGLPVGTIDDGNNIDSDPLFVDADGTDNIPGTNDDDLRLGPLSPCIDAGDNSAVTVSLDLGGHLRIADDPASPDCPQAPGTCGTPPIVDMGAYEFGSMPCRLADLDDDGDVDLDDFSRFQACFDVTNGLACNPTVTPDLDENGRVDLDDYSVFSLCVTGPD